MTQEKALAKFDAPQAIVFNQDYSSGISAEDLALPRYDLVQAMSKAHSDGNAPVGQFYSRELDIAKPSMNLIVLRVEGGRVLFGEELGAPVCASDDNINPRPDMAFLGPCATCPERDRTCRKTYSVLAYDIDGKTPCVFRVRGMSAVRFKGYMTQVFAQHGGRFFEMATAVSAVKETNKQGTYFVSRFQATKEKFPDAAIAKIAEYAKSFKTRIIGQVDEEAPEEQEDSLDGNLS